jgi:thiol-disulfide isomerase/thioredoxin
VRPALRWIVVVAVLVLAAAVALWPRGADDDQPAGAPPSADPSARAAAALPRCPTGPVGPSQLAGAQAECLADGSTVDFSRLVSTGPVLVNVWATWCDPCREELPVLAEYAARDGAARVVTVAVQSKPADALDLLAALRVRLPSVLDTDDAVSTALRVPKALPASYVVDATGAVRMVTEPRVFRSADDVATAVGS